MNEDTKKIWFTFSEEQLEKPWALFLGANNRWIRIEMNKNVRRDLSWKLLPQCRYFLAVCFNESCDLTFVRSLARLCPLASLSSCFSSALFGPASSVDRGLSRDLLESYGNQSNVHVTKQASFSINDILPTSVVLLELMYIVLG